MKIKLALIGLFLVLCQHYAMAADYYWVGGTGLWSEVNGHWATTSGGTTFHAIVPTSQDNVIFDENSFTAAGQTVTLDGNFANCANMDWSNVTNNPVFKSAAGGTLYVFGSIGLSEDMSVSLACDIELQGNTTGLTIETNGNQLTSSNLTFNNASGEWTLMDSLSVGDEIQLRNGALITNGNSVYSDFFDVLDATYLDISNSTITANRWWTISGTEAELITTNSTVQQLGSSGGVGNGKGYVFDRLIINGHDGLYIDSVKANYLEFGTRSRVNFNVGEIDHLVVKGQRFEVDGGSNVFHKAEIYSKEVDFLAPSLSNNFSPDQIFDSLIFRTPGTVVTITPSTQTINNYLFANGTCDSMIVIKSSEPGTPVNFVSAADIELDFVAISDCHITGGATYELNNSIDLGRNSGWLINEPGDDDLYWIGTSSNNWNDGDNWSLTSGGTPYGCPPTPLNNVFFDENSFTTAGTVEINSTAYARDIDWTGAKFTPTLEGNSELNVSGSLYLIEDLKNEFRGNIHFNSCNTGNKIRSAGNKLTTNNVYFQCEQGEWELEDSLEIDGVFRLNLGSVDASNTSVRAGYYYLSDLTSFDMRNSDVYTNKWIMDWGITKRYFWVVKSEVNLQTENSNLYINNSTANAWYGSPGYTYANIHLQKTANFNCDGCTVDTVFVDSVNAFFNVKEANVDHVIVDANDFVLKGDESFIRKLNINAESNVTINDEFRENSISVDSLIVSNPGVQVNLSDTIHVNQFLDLSGDCSNITKLVSTEQGKKSHIFYDKNLQIEYAFIRDIEIGTGGTYEAIESTDGGGNEGWDFTEPLSKTLYWIGGEGNWNNGANWSLTSGGSPSGCAPSPLDTAIFDQNSFDAPNQKVKTSSSISLTTMDWRDVTQDPIFEAADEITINGSLMYSEDMTLETLVDYQFNSCEEGNVIQTGNHDDFSRMASFNCSTGEWTLVDSLKVNNTINLHGGNLLLDENYLEVNLLTIHDSVVFDFSGSTLLINSSWNVGVENAQLLSDSSLILFGGYSFDGGTGYDYWDLHIYRAGSQYSYKRVEGDELSFNTVILDENYQEIRTKNSAINHLVLNGDMNRIGGDANYIPKADFNSETSITILGEQVFDTLGLNTAGQQIIFQSEKVQTINHEFNIIQEPNFPIFISSTTQGVQGHINFLGTKPPCSEYLFIRDNDIYGRPGVPFYAGLDSDDIDNNTGWIFETNADCNTLLCEFEGVELDLGDDVPLFCLDYTFEVDPVQVEADYQWAVVSIASNPKDSLTEFTITETATVVLTISTEICTISDTVVATKGDCSVIPLEICEGDSVLLKPSLADDTHLWNTGSTDDSIYVKTDGFFWVDNDDGSGTVVRDSFFVEVNAYPQFDLGNDTILCNTGYSYTLPSGLDSFTWSFGGTNPSFTIDTSAYVWAEVEKNNCIVRDTILIQVDSIDFTGFGRKDTTLCSLNDTISYNLVLENLSYVWENGDTGYEIGEKDITQPGVYWVEVFSDLGCKVRDSITVNLSDIKPINLGNDTLLCNNEELSLTIDNVYDITLWSDGEQDHEMTVDFMGKYWASALKGSCIASDTIIVNKVEVSFGGGLGKDTTLCSGDSLYWNETLPASLSYEWEDGTSGTTQLERTIKNAGVYWLEIDSYGCKARDSIEVNVVSTEAISLGADTVLCGGASLDLSVPEVYDTYTWSTGASGNNITVTTSGEYWLTVAKSSCQASDTILVEAYTSPSVDLGKDTTLCSGDSLYWNETLPSGLSYEWEDGTSGTMQLERTIKDAGVYWLEIDSYGCKARDSIEVNVVSTEAISLGADTVLCGGASLDLSVSDVYDTYTWSTGASGNNITVTTSGEYWLTVAKSSCQASDTILVEANSFPDFSLGKDTTLCPQTSLVFKEDSAVVNYTWDNGLTGNGLIDRTVTVAGIYWLEIEKNGCSARDSILVSILNYNESGLGKDTLLCPGTAITLTVNSGFDAYTWSTGAATPSNTITAEGEYWVDITQNNCVFRDSIAVLNFTMPAVFENNEPTVCSGNQLIIEETFSGFDYQWENGDNGFENVYREIDAAGLYWLELSSGWCSVRDTLIVKEKNSPVFDIGNDTSICSMETLFLTLPSGFSNPVWDNGSTSDTYLVDESGLYSVHAKWENCSVYDDIYITLVEDLCPEDPLVFPTAFTPNGDGINDTWVIDGLEQYPNSRVQIFNRWGHLIFESNNYQNQWGGDDLPMGTYYYALWNEESNKEITGTVTILRME